MSMTQNFFFSLPLVGVSALPACSNSDPFSCWGNGDCIDNAYCKCAPGWKGEHCNMLDLMPIRKHSPGLMLSSQWPSDAASSWTMNPNWGGGAIWENGYWYIVVGMKKNPDRSNLFSDNAGIYKFRAREIGGPYKNLGEITGANGQSFGFRADVKRHPIDNSILIAVDGYVYNPTDNDFGFGFSLLRYHTGSILGPFTEHNLVQLGRNTSTIGQQWGADPNNTDEYRFDCRMADPTLVILDDGSVLLGYRGTKCCCDNVIGTWDIAGNHAYETASYFKASNWKGPYVRSGVKILGELTDNEDMHFWKDSRGVHMMSHSQDNSHHNHDRRGGYAFSPDGGVTWKLEKDFGVWIEDYLVFDDCSGMHIAKRQRPSIIFHPETGLPMYLMSGVATTEHGLEWGDGWTAFQPINNGMAPDVYSSNCTVNGGAGECCTHRCPVGKVGDSASGTCTDCSSSSLVTDGDCLVGNFASNDYRATCTCNRCENSKLGKSCEYASNVQSSTCHGEGWKVQAGTQHGYGDGALAVGTGGPYFRCGSVDGNGAGTGWFGNCIPAYGECNGVSNCGDGADEANCSGFVKTCAWPTAKIGGVCKECVVDDVNMTKYPHYVSCLEAFTSANQLECTCLKGVFKTTTSTTTQKPITTTTAEAGEPAEVTTTTTVTSSSTAGTIFSTTAADVSTTSITAVFTTITTSTGSVIPPDRVQVTVYDVFTQKATVSWVTDLTQVFWELHVEQQDRYGEVVVATWTLDSTAQTNERQVFLDLVRYLYRFKVRGNRIDGAPGAFSPESNLYGERLERATTTSTTTVVVDNDLQTSGNGLARIMVLPTTSFTTTTTASATGAPTSDSNTIVMTTTAHRDTIIGTTTSATAPSSPTSNASGMTIVATTTTKLSTITTASATQGMGSTAVTTITTQRSPTSTKGAPSPSSSVFLPQRQVKDTRTYRALTAFLDLEVAQSFEVHTWILEVIPALEAAVSKYLDISKNFVGNVNITGAQLFLEYSSDARKIAAFELRVLLLPVGVNVQGSSGVISAESGGRRLQASVRLLDESDKKYDAEFLRIRTALEALSGVSSGASLVHQRLKDLFVDELKRRSLVVPEDFELGPSKAAGAAGAIKTEDVQVDVVVVEEVVPSGSSGDLEDGMPMWAVVAVIVLAALFLLFLGVSIWKLNHMMHLVAELKHNNSEYGFVQGLRRTATTALQRGWSGKADAGWSYFAEEKKAKLELAKQVSELEHQKEALEEEKMEHQALKRDLRKESSEFHQKRKEKEKEKMDSDAEKRVPQQQKAEPYRKEMSQNEGLHLFEASLWAALDEHLDQYHKGSRNEKQLDKYCIQRLSY